MGSVTTTLSPSLQNYFDLSVDNEVRIRVEEPSGHGNVEGSVIVWKNSHLSSAITPYVPSEEDEAFLATCRAVFNINNNQESLIASCESFFLHHDLSVVVLGLLDLKSVINFSKTNKSMYLVAKQDVIWENQLLNLLPNVHVIASSLCIFPAQQQFQIINQRINDERKAYQAKFYRIEKNCQRIRKLSKHKDNLISLPHSYSKETLSAQAGKNYDGTAASISATSDLGRLLHAIEVLVPAEFNKQEKFEEVIRQAEAIKNSTSATTGSARLS